MHDIIAELIDVTESDSVSCSMVYNMCSIILAMGKTAYDNAEMLVTEGSRHLAHCIFCNKKVFFTS